LSSLFLVRHAQASFFAEDYDQLSEIGEQQATLLGSYWARSGTEFGQVIVGPRRRHQQTAEIVGRQFREAGLRWPDAVVRPALDEHCVDVLMKDQLDQLAANDSRINDQLRQLARTYAEATTKQDKQRRFQKLFEAVAHLWIDDAIDAAEVESWREFRNRVVEGIDRIRRDAGRGKRVAVFTSVGPISVALLRALDCSEKTALELGWRIRNGSLTRFVFSEDRFTLDSFNGVPHLDDALLTYR